MTGSSPDPRTPDDAPTLTDPATVLDREDVDYVESTRYHARKEHYELADDRPGHAVVGVTHGDETLVILDEDGSNPSLPFRPVESGEDFATVAARAVEALTGVAVDLDGIERVRRVTHHLETGADRSTTAYEVLFRATPTGDPTVADGAPLVHPDREFDLPDDHGLSAEWVSEMPATDDLRADPTDDLRVFLE